MDKLLVFSHLRWDFVYQRPQHLMTRLARHARVYFFEEPVRCDGHARLEMTERAPNVWVCRPHTPEQGIGFHDDQIATLQRLLEDLARAENLRDAAVWLYTPMALPLLQGLKPRVIIYDCMDELSAFKDPPRQLRQRENALLKMAHVVFTGGRSLYEAKKTLHPEVHCFPSSVDAAHFAAGSDGALDHPEQAALAHPRLGFFGVIDERFDVELLRQLAAARPRWQLVCVGPTVKIHAAELPHAPNIHYFGQRDYRELPSFLAGWDVCLLPFALNDATRYISPTKTLEYMAAGKPVVSTPVPDVVASYGDIVRIAERTGFVRACESALEESPGEAEQRAQRMRRAVAETSWDRTAERMLGIIEATAPERIRQNPLVAPAPKAQSCNVAIIGAGPTGLSAAYHLGTDSVLFERNPTVGGWCRSVRDHGFTFDCAGHIMFSKDPYVLRMYEILLGKNIHWQDREAWIYSKGTHTRYPFQGALHGLPPEVISECIMGAVEARMGAHPSRKGSAMRGAAELVCKPESIVDCCADGISESTAPLGDASRDAPGNFEDFIYSVWGRGIAKHFALPYNSKLWTVPLAEMETSWLNGRVPQPDLREMIEGALRPPPKPMGPNARFGYPLHGGFQALMDGFLPHLKGELRLNSAVTRIFPAEHRLMLADGSLWSYERLISTMPLPLLVKAMGSAAPARVQEAAAKLRHVSVRCVNLGVGRSQITDKHWIYYPESTVFHRIFMQGNASPYANAPGGFGLTCEISYSAAKPLPWDRDALTQRCIEDCIAVGVLRPDDKILTSNQVDMPYAYVVYDHGRAANVRTIRNWAASQGITLAGRYSEWEYYNSDHAFLAGLKATEDDGLARSTFG